MLFILLLAVSALLRLWYVLQPSPLWWDTAIYITMGKFLFSGGALGFWETLRPPLFPVIIGAAWKIGIDPVIFGKLLMILSSLGIIGLVYALGEDIRKNAGLAAAALISFTFVFITFAIVPLTDIPSAFTALLAVWLAVRGRYVSSGLAASATFFLRFPLGLIFVPLGILAITAEGSWLKKAKNAVLLASSFIVLFSGYLILNARLFGDALLPMKLGQISMAQSVYVPEPFFYYAIKLILENPLFIFAFVFAGIIISKRELLRARPVLASVVSLIVIGGYLSSLAHKEIRYSLAFLPYTALLAGAGLVYALEKFKITKPRTILAVASAVPLAITLGTASFYTPPPTLAPEYIEFYHFFDDKKDKVLMTTAPQIGALNDIPVLELFDTYEEGARAVADNKSRVDYVAIESCNIRCEKQGADCSPAKQQLDDQLKTARRAFDKTAGQCRLTVYMLRP